MDRMRPFPTVIYSSISGGDLVILSERAVWSSDTSTARAAGGGRETDNDSWGGQQEQNVTVKDGPKIKTRWESHADMRRQEVDSLRYKTQGN